jgi:hypothetical protein
MRTAFAVLSIASFLGLVALIGSGIHQVHMGSHLDAYRTSWLVEFNWVVFLVLVVILVVALVGFAVVRYLESRESRT